VADFGRLREVVAQALMRAEGALTEGAGIKATVVPDKDQVFLEFWVGGVGVCYDPGPVKP
jgi:hypothetical protein